MDDSQKVSILMAEYNTLRAEVLAAGSSVAQAIGLAAAVIMGDIGFTFSTSFSGPQWVPWLIAVLALAYLGGSFFWNETKTRAFTKRLRALEADINARAGERLLVWETDSGWGSMIVPRDSQ